MEYPTVMFIQETKCSKETFKTTTAKFWKGSESITIDAKDVVGGISIIWNPLEIRLSNFLATRFTIYADFHILGTSLRGILNNVYGPFSLAPEQAFIHSLDLLSQ